MRKLKLFSLLLLLFLGVGQMWATDVTYTFTSKSWADASNAWTGGGDGNGFTSGQGIQVTTGTSGANATSKSSFSNISKVVVTYNTNKSKGAGSIVIKIGTNAEVSNSVSYSGSADGTSANFTTQFDFSPVQTGAIKITTNTTTNSIWVKSITITYDEGQGGGGDEPGDPSLSVSPTSWDFGEVAVSDEASKVFSVSGSNLTAGTLSISVPEGFSVSPSSISVTEATLAATNVTVSKNTTAIDDYSGNLSISATCGLTEAKTVALEMSVVADPEPTGTFEPFSGDIEEGDYLIVADGAGMNTTVSSSRLQYTALTLTGENYVNPDESVIWHIAESATAGYWTIYSGAESKYAAATGSNNQAQMLESGTDNKSLWGITHSEAVYTITNKSNSRFLKKNGTYGFGCYADGTVSLYKKQVAGQPKTPTFSVAGGNYESAQTVEISCETTGATIHYTIDGTTPTSASPTYSIALNISSTTTVKAIAIKDDIASTVASATYTIVIWQTVDEIWSSITSEGPNNAHVWGYVSQANVGGYNNNYYISVDGSLTANQLEIYKGNNGEYTVSVGDKVHVNGNLTIFNNIKEFAQNTGVIVHYEAKGALSSVAVSSTPDKTTYAANEDFDPEGMVVSGTYANGYVEVITDGITWANDLIDGKVTETTTVHVTATVSGITNDPAYDVPVTVAAKTLVSIAVGTVSYTIYTGEALPKPTVTATFSEGDPEDVSNLAVYDSESVFDTEAIDDPDPQTITVSYTFGGATQTATYTVSVKDYANEDDAPYTVAEALNIITKAIGNTESAREIVVTGTVSEENINNNKNRYKISDGTNELLVYAGKGFNSEDFTNTNYPKVNDVVKVKGKVINYGGNTPEFASGKSYLLSQVRPATIAIENVASLEVGATDLTEDDLDITTTSDGEITFVSGDETKATIVENAIHAVAPGTVTITANLAATSNEDALDYAAASTTFSVTVVTPPTKYSISFDGNGADGGSAPAAIADKAAGAEVTLPANSYTKAGFTFDGWKVTYLDGEEVVHEVTIENNAFEMPASNVTIQAQWAEISKWATTYTSNLADVNNGGSIVKFYGDDKEYNAIKAGTGKAAGSTTITVPAQASKLHFHAYGWNGESVTLSITAPAGVTVSPATQAISSNTGISGSTSTYTLAEGSTPETDAYFAVNLSGNNDEIELTISATSGNRFVLFGVNQEGGVLPVLDHIAITGTMTNTTGWKTGDEITPEGLTVNAIYTLNSVEQDPVDVTSSVVWSHAALVEGQTKVTLTATYTEGEVTKTATTDDITIDAVETGAPSITTDVNSRSWTVDQNADIPASKTFTVTMKNITSASVTLGGDNTDAFSITPATLTANGDITVTVVSTETAGTYSATITIKDADSETSKTVNVSLTVNELAVDDDVTGTWTLVTNETTLAAGQKVIIAQYVNADGAINTMASQSSNNRSVIASTVAGTTLTPTVGTKVMTLADAGEGHFYLKTSDGEYLYNASTSDKSYLRTKAEEENVSWTIAVDAEGVATITSVENTNRTKMRYNPNTSGNPLFNCYASGQNDIALYMLEETTPTPTPDPEPEQVVITDDDAVISDVDDDADVVVKNGGVLTVNADKTINSVVIEAGGVLALGANTLTADELIIQANGATSSQMTGVVDANPATSTESNVNVGEIYFEKKNFVTACRHWYNVAVPFPVNINGGIQRADGQPLEWNTHFDFYQYNGSRRATEGADGGNWDKVAENGQLVPGVNYLCVFDQAYGTIRFKKADGNLNNAGNIGVDDFGYATTSSADAGWNGIANNGLTYASASLEDVVLVQVLKSTGDGYATIILSNAVFVVGTPFFVQTSKDANVVFGAESGSQYYGAPQRTSGTSFELIAVELMQNNNVADRVFVNASEDAENQYVIGKDLAKFSVSTTTAQLWINNYNKKLCANDVQLVNNQAIYDLGLYAPAAGTYSISAQQVEGATLYVTYNGAIVWNLSLGDYELDLTRGTTTGYGLLLVAQPNQMPTGLDTTEGVSGDAVQKILLNGQLYILRDGHLFDAVGHEMK